MTVNMINTKEELIEGAEKLKRYNELVRKMSAKPFNGPKVKGQGHTLLTDDESFELAELKIYFNGARINDASVMLVDAAINYALKKKFWPW